MCFNSSNNAYSIQVAIATARHVRVKHHTEMNCLECPCCGEYQGKSLGNLIRHVRLIHADRAFSVRCRGYVRDKLFKNFYTWRDHMYSYHGESELEKEPVPEPSESVVIDTEDMLDEEELAVEPADDFGRENLQHAAAIFILKVQETHQLPRT